MDTKKTMTWKEFADEYKKVLREIKHKESLEREIGNGSEVVNRILGNPEIWEKEMKEKDSKHAKEMFKMLLKH